MIIETSTIFNNSTLNIFTDSSLMKETDQSTTCCAGCNVYLNDLLISEEYAILRSTNNYAELYAILLGIINAIKCRNENINKINIFSDSLLCVNGLNYWIIDWVSRSMDGVLFNSSGKPVENQKLFIQCMNMIYNYNLQISIYHMRGHMRLTKNSDIMEFKSGFINHNKINGNISDPLVFKLIGYNSIIDNNTRECLKVRPLDIPVLEFPNDIRKLMCISRIKPEILTRYLELINESKL